MYKYDSMYLYILSMIKLTRYYEFMYDHYYNTFWIDSWILQNSIECLTCNLTTNFTDLNVADQFKYY